MELYSGTPSGTHNIYWGNYDWFSLYGGYSNSMYGSIKYFTKEEFMIIAYITNMADITIGSLGTCIWGTFFVYISATNTNQLTFRYPLSDVNSVSISLRGIYKK